VTLQIHTITVGPVNRYLIGDSSWMLVDTGVPLTERMVLRALERLRIAPQQVQLILLTHGHVDHAGAASALKRRTGARLAIHESDLELIESGRVVVPRMWDATARVLVKPVEWIASMMRFPPVAADIVIGDGGLALHDLGVRGRVVHTPGHTSGSVSLVLDSGEAFVGDLGGMGGPRRSAGIPPAGNDRQLILESWRRILELQVTHIYPGHGPSLSAAEMRAGLGL
jgi:glyoxylase-like metal-dependent hydrolase (beta-lactamase superfamily II)